MLGGTTGELPTYYQDAAVIAYRLPKSDKNLTQLAPNITSSGGTFTLAELTDGDLANERYLPPMEVGQPMWIQYAFASPQTVKAFALAGASHSALEDFNGGPANRSFSVSDDGITFRQVATVSASIVPQNTVRIPPTTARFFRVNFTTLPPEVNMFAVMAGAKPEAGKPVGVNVAELVLYTTDRVDQFEDKAGFTPWKEEAMSTGGEPADAIPTADVLDLTTNLSADGTLTWTAPPGDWMVVAAGLFADGSAKPPRLARSHRSGGR